MQIYHFFVLYNIFLSIKNKLSNFQYWGFERLGVRLLSKTMDYASKNRSKNQDDVIVDHCQTLLGKSGYKEETNV